MAERMTALEAYREGRLTLPPSYGLECDSELLPLRRDDGSVAAGFNTDRVVPSEVAWTAEQDHRRHGRSSA